MRSFPAEPSTAGAAGLQLQGLQLGIAACRVQLYSSRAPTPWAAAHVFFFWVGTGSGCGWDLDFHAGAGACAGALVIRFAGPVMYRRKLREDKNSAQPGQ